jgi:hypothetical protein
MPLVARLRDDHYPDAAPTPRLDYYVVLSGGLGVGGYHRIGSGPSEGRWSWGAGLGNSSAAFSAGGYAAHPDVCRTLIGLAFRRMLARADLRERADARPGAPHRATQGRLPRVSHLLPPSSYDRDADRRRGPMLRNELHISVRSGELVVGLLSRATHGPERWFWSLTGLPRPDDHFEWRGEDEADDEAFDALAACWSRWVDWAGLESVAALQRGVRR